MPNHVTSFERFDLPKCACGSHPVAERDDMAVGNGWVVRCAESCGVTTEAMGNETDAADAWELMREKSK